VKLIGFKPLRFHQWIDVIREEGRNLTTFERLTLALTLAEAALNLGIPRAQWRTRMKTCFKCPIYDRHMKRCRPQTGHILGCGCFTPFLALVERPYPKPGCWARQTPELEHLGWL